MSTNDKTIMPAAEFLKTYGNVKMTRAVLDPQLAMEKWAWKGIAADGRIVQVLTHQISGPTRTKDLTINKLENDFNIELAIMLEDDKSPFTVSRF